MKKVLVLGVLFGLFAATATASDYSTNGNNVFYKGKKIGEVQSAYGGWKGLCEHRSSGRVQTYSQKQDAMQSVVNECRTY